MVVMVHIPDAFAARLAVGGEDLSRRALEALALGELRVGHLTEEELGTPLGLDAGETDRLLQAHGVHSGYTPEEIRTQVATLERLGFWCGSSSARVTL